jgi:hypothetical protein
VNFRKYAFRWSSSLRKSVDRERHGFGSWSIDAVPSLLLYHGPMNVVKIAMMEVGGGGLDQSPTFADVRFWLRDSEDKDDYKTLGVTTVRVFLAKEDESLLYSELKAEMIRRAKGMLKEIASLT